MPTGIVPHLRDVPLWTAPYVAAQCGRPAAHHCMCGLPTRRGTGRAAVYVAKLACKIPCNVTAMEHTLSDCSPYLRILPPLCSTTIRPHRSVSISRSKFLLVEAGFYL